MHVGRLSDILERMWIVIFYRGDRPRDLDPPLPLLVTANPCDILYCIAMDSKYSICIKTKELPTTVARMSRKGPILP